MPPAPRVSLGPNGLQLQLESLRALVLGGIAFDTPTQARGSPVSAENHDFPLYAEQGRRGYGVLPAAHCHSWHISVARSPGWRRERPVTLRGIRIGEVQQCYVGIRCQNRQRGGPGALRR